MKKFFKRRRTYLISVEDVARLERVASVRLTPLKMILIIIAGCILWLAGGAAVVMLTPIKQILPGYMKANERTVTQESILRLDSLNQATMRRDAYLASIIRAMDTSRPADTISESAAHERTTSFDPDSLMLASPRERRFVGAMHEREKYNLSVLAPLAADRMDFITPVRGGIFPDEARESLRAEIAAPADAPVLCVSDGTVVASYVGKPSEGGVVVVQHDHGFVSRYSGLELPSVSTGDRIECGRAVAYHAARRSDGTRRAVLEMWHDSDPVIPYRFVGDKED